MAPKLYMALTSPPVRAVLMCAKAIGLELELVELDIFHGEQLNPDFLKLNPLHKVPTLDDDGFVLYDSHAILSYFIGRYAKDKSLYPEDIKKRALIDQRLHFDSSILFPRYLRVCLPIYAADGVTEVIEETAKYMLEAYGFLEAFLQNTKYVAGDNLSIADFSLVATITNASLLVPLDENKFPRITAWRALMATLPYYELNRVGFEKYRDIICLKLTK